MRFGTTLFLLSIALALPALLAPGALATTMEVAGVPQSKSVELSLTLKAGTSAMLKDEFGTTSDTCTTSELTTKTEAPFSGTSVGGPITKWTLANCTHTTDVLKSGSLRVAWASGTDGTVSQAESHVTLVSTFFGTSALCDFGKGTTIGTLTGKIEGTSVVDLNIKVNCGVLGNTSWTGTYSVTSPSGLGVVS